MIFCVEDDNNIRDLLVYTLETTAFSKRPGRSFGAVAGSCTKRSRN